MLRAVWPCVSTLLGGTLSLGVSPVRPNHSVKRTRNGMPSLAFISFWAKAAMPLRAAYLKR
jgi:hypothetical protein